MPKLNLQEIRFGSVVPTGDRITPNRAEKTPSPFICEAITLPAYDEIPYVFDLEEREYLEFTLRSDTPVDVLVCNMADYERWIDSGYDPEIALLVHLEAEDVLASKRTLIIRPTAPGASDPTAIRVVPPKPVTWQKMR